MTKNILLIKLYCAVSEYNVTILAAHAQRQSNNFRPKFTDEECIATFIWGIYNQKFTVKACNKFIEDYYSDWFPNLPSYQAYNHRVCYLADSLMALADALIQDRGLDVSHTDFVLDSLPIIVASHRRRFKAKAAQEICSIGYCSTKKIHYYGAKLHSLAQCNHKAMPCLASLMVTDASTHDLTAAKQILSDVCNIRLFGDLAYFTKDWHSQMRTDNNVCIITPIKRKQGQKKLFYWQRTFSAAVSSIRQTIESFFNWLIEKTNIQKASKVRSPSGFLAFIFARVACACFSF